jgi:mono/diheme cytochrome c family protein
MIRLLVLVPIITAIASVTWAAGGGDVTPSLQVQSDNQRAHFNASEYAQGRAIYAKWCSSCHDDGPRYPGTAALMIKYQGALPAVLSLRTDLTPEFISYYVRHGFSAMPIFRKTEIDDRQLSLLAAYLTHHAHS